MSVRPARIGRVADQGRSLATGEPAHLALVDPSGQWTVDPSRLASLSRNTPFAGRTLPARVVATFYNGQPTVLDGSLAEVSV
jgi:dihydroorotase